MPELIEHIPPFKFVVLIKRVATAFGANADRNLFSVFAMFPFLQQLKFEQASSLYAVIGALPHPGIINSTP